MEILPISYINSLYKLIPSVSTVCIKNKILWSNKLIAIKVLFNLNEFLTKNKFLFPNFWEFFFSKQLPISYEKKDQGFPQRITNKLRKQKIIKKRYANYNN